jgi:hypothetical protein
MPTTDGRGSSSALASQRFTVKNWPGWAASIRTPAVLGLMGHWWNGMVAAVPPKKFTQHKETAKDGVFNQNANSS